MSLLTAQVNLYIILFLGLQQKGREADRSPTRSAKVKNT